MRGVKLGISGRLVPDHVSDIGLALIVIINIGAFLVLGMESVSILLYRGREAGFINAAEASYLTAQWLKLGVGAALLLVLDIVAIGIAVANRLDRLLDAQLFAAAEVAAALERQPSLAAATPPDALPPDRPEKSLDEAGQHAQGRRFERLDQTR